MGMEAGRTLPTPNIGNSANLEQTPVPDVTLTSDIDWSSWLGPQTEDLDFNSLRSLSGQMRAQESENPSSYPVAQPTSGPQNAHNMQFPAVDNQGRQAPPTSPSLRARREAAEGMAMITLEAAAEPHYVGESSGSFWSDVVAQGMCEQHSGVSGRKRSRGTPRNRSPSPTDRHILRTSLQRQLSNEAAKHILLTVYRHLHSRVSQLTSVVQLLTIQYPFLDWVAFDRHWQAREGLLLAVAIDRKLNEEASIAAFFVLMVLAIGAHLCKNDHLVGLLRPEEYHALALPFLPVIVQLHNLVNVQGEFGAEE